MQPSSARSAPTVSVFAGLALAFPLALTGDAAPTRTGNPASARQAPAAQAPVDEAAEAAAEDARERRRLLHMARGPVLRAKTRCVDGRWQYRTDNTWRTLPPESVVRVESERDVLAQAEKLRRSAEDPTRRVALADWMIREGLYVEASQELDRVLRADPDSAPALQLLQSNPPPLALPHVAPAGVDAEPDFAELLRYASGATPCVRELAVNELRAHESEQLLSTLRSELSSHSVRRRDFATLALRRVFPGQDLPSLLDRAVLDGSEDVRAGASLALRDAEDTELVVPLARALSSSHPKVRQHSIQALGNMGYGAAVEPLMAHLAALPAAAQSSNWRPPASHIFVGRQTAYVQDYDVEVAQGAAIADPQINTQIEGSVLDVRIFSVRAESVAIESRHVRSALAQLTGADPGRTSKAWLDWWEENRGEWAMVNFLPEADAATDGRTTARQSTGT